MEDFRKSYGSLYATASAATLIMLVIIPIQILVYARTPAPGSVEDWFELLATNPLVGFFHADFFMLVDNLLIAVIYLGFYHVLKERHKGILQAALLLGFIGIASYVASNKTFEVQALSREFAPATVMEARGVLLAAGRALTAEWQGTAYDVYYVLNGITLLVVGALMMRDRTFGRTTALWGLSSGFLMTVPPTAGEIGLVFSLLSLVPWYIFSIRFGLVFFKIARGKVEPR